MRHLLPEAVLDPVVSKLEAEVVDLFKSRALDLEAPSPQPTDEKQAPLLPKLSLESIGWTTSRDSKGRLRPGSYTSAKRSPLSCHPPSPHANRRSPKDSEKEASSSPKGTMEEGSNGDLKERSSSGGTRRKKLSRSFSGLFFVLPDLARAPRLAHFHLVPRELVEVFLKSLPSLQEE